MEAIIFIIVCIATVANIIFIYSKFNNGRVLEASIDIGTFIGLVYILSVAGQGGMYVGMVASAAFSIYLYFNPPKINII